MRKILSMLMLLAMLLAMSTGAMAENTPEGQVKPVTLQESVWYYDADGSKLANASSLGGDAVVRLSKTAASTGTENEFEVTLEVSTTQDIREISSGSPDAATLLIMDISDTMSRCAICGEKDASHRNKGHIEQTRLSAAADRAEALIDQFAAMGNGGGRYVALVVFDGSSARKFDWMDVTNPANKAAAKNIIDGLVTGHGTNIEAGLMLGANVWNSDTVRDINYKYTILLTDGTPTSYVSDRNTNTTNRESITGTIASNYATSEDTVKDVGRQAERILNLGGLSRLYSICFGQGVWSDKPFGDYANAVPATNRNMTVLDWMAAFSTKAYKAEDADELYVTFDTIISQIILAAQAWKVDDVMGSDVVYLGKSHIADGNNISFGGNSLHWDVLASDAEVTQTGDQSVQLDYVLRYKVKLDNLSTDYAGGWTDTNDAAKLTYAVYDEESDLWTPVQPVDFPEPQVLGYEAELVFQKYYVDNGEEKPVSGMQFRLEAMEDAQTGETWGPVTATSDENGYVTFTGIPSGHTYNLEELNAADQHFAAPGNIPVTVAWGAATSERFEEDQEGYKLLNKKTEQEVTLTLSKIFGSEAHPSSITFEVSGPEGYTRTVKLPVKMADGSSVWSETISGLEAGEYTITESAAMDGYDMEASATLGGENVELNNGSATVALTLSEEESHHAYEVVFNNSYERRVGSVTIEKTFHERTQESMDGEPVLVPLDPALYQAATVVVEFVNEQGDAEAVVELPQAGEGGEPVWSATVDDLPEGTYTIVEKVEHVIPEHDFVHMHLKMNGDVVTGDQVTISDGSRISLELENHYMHHVGHIFVEKAFAGIEPALVPADKAFYVDVYEAGYQQGDAPVAEIRIERNDEGDWTGMSKQLKVGEYVLVERTGEGNAEMAIDNYTFVGFVFDREMVVVQKGAAPVFSTLTNSYVPGAVDLVISKTVQSEYDFDKTRPYAFELLIPAAANQTLTVSNGVEEQQAVLDEAGLLRFTLSDGQSLTVKGIAYGAEYTVREAAAEGMTATVNGQAAEIVDGQAVFTGDTETVQAVAFVNARGEGNGELAMTKLVDSPLRGDYEKAFSFTVKMDDAAIEGTFAAKVENGASTAGTQVVFAAGEASVALRHGEKMVISGLPAGVGFTVTETAETGFAVTANASNASSVSGVTGQGVQADFVNTSTVGKGTLTVSKTVAGSAASEEDVFTFEVSIPALMDGVYGEMAFAGGKATVQLKHGQTATAQGIPVGAAYTVTETDPGNYTPNVTAYTGTMTEQGVEAAFVNTLTLQELPATGDNSRLLLWGAMLALAGAALMLIRRAKA